MGVFAGDIAAGAAALGVDFDADSLTRLESFIDGLQRWNRVYNLTAVRDPAAMVVQHLLDSLAVRPWLPASGRVIDVGSGAGLPGIPLSIVSPELSFTLLDSSAKRTRFIRQMVAELGLVNVAVVHGRVQDCRDESGFQAVLSRAFASLADFVEASRHLCAGDGRLLAMKGVYPRAEIDALPAAAELIAVRKLLVPGLDAERHLLEIGFSGSIDPVNSPR